MLMADDQPSSPNVHPSIANVFSLLTPYLYLNIIHLRSFRSYPSNQSVYPIQNQILFSKKIQIHSTMSQTVVLKVGMSCGGCVGAVKRVLGKMEGVETFDIDLEQQKVTVKGNVQPDAVLQTVSKTGKKTEFWPAESASAVA